MNLETLAKQAYEARQYDKAVRLYRKAINKKPDHKILFSGLAQSLYRLHNYEEALSTIEQGVQLEGNPTQLYLIRGKCLYYLGHHVEAEKSFQCALETVTDEITEGETLISLGKMYIDQDNTQEALSLLKKGVASYPQSWYGHYLLAVVYNSLGQAKKARKEILVSFKTNPSVYSLGYMLFLYTSLLMKILLPLALVYAYGDALISRNIIILLLLIVFLLGSGLYFIKKGNKKIGIRGVLLGLFVFLIYAIFWVIGR